VPQQVADAGDIACNRSTSRRPSARSRRGATGLLTGAAAHDDDPVVSG
jgi:hypothetical protein